MAGTALAAMFASGGARADDDVATAARSLYDQGAAAYDARDFPRAAQLLARADELAPNPVVLKLALAAALQTDDAVVGMTLVRRADERPPDPAVARVARTAQSRFEGQVGYVRVSCTRHPDCRVDIDGRAYGDRALAIVRVGPVEATFTDPPTRFRLQVPARATVDLAEPVPNEPMRLPNSEPLRDPVSIAPSGTGRPPVEEPRRGGLHRNVFFVGVGLTAVAGSFAIASGIDTSDKHDAFLRSPTEDARSSGESAELRTNVLLGVTAGLALITGIIGVVMTNWRP